MTERLHVSILAHNPTFDPRYHADADAKTVYGYSGIADYELFDHHMVLIGACGEHTVVPLGANVIHVSIQPMRPKEVNTDEPTSRPPIPLRRKTVVDMPGVDRPHGGERDPAA